MKYLILLFCGTLFFSCGKDKVILLPEITHAEITEITDVSAAYLFYDETQPDSIELNRKNIISTTNWLVNVDKRLTLKQAIPKIKLLQEKKRNAKMHKNKAAKNYYTCNDTSRKNLGFIEFTDVVYKTNSNLSEISDSVIKKEPFLLLNLSEEKEITVYDLFAGKIITRGVFNNNEIESTLFKNYINGSYSRIIIRFDKNLTFQEYISFKSLIILNKAKHKRIHNNEFIY